MPVPLASMALSLKDDAVRSFKEGLLRPKRHPFMMRVQAGTWRALWVLYEQIGPTTGSARWVRKPSAIDETAGNVARVEIPQPSGPPVAWTMDCACLMLSGIDANEDAGAIAVFKRVVGKMLPNDTVFTKAISGRTPLAAAFSMNQELLENPVLSVAAYCFAEAFFEQFGVSTD